MHLDTSKCLSSVKGGCACTQTGSASHQLQGSQHQVRRHAISAYLPFIEPVGHLKIELGCSPIREREDEETSQEGGSNCKEAASEQILQACT